MAEPASPLDDFVVRFAGETPGARIAKTGHRLILHNDQEPCPAAESLKNPSTSMLGREEAPRPELKRFCRRCRWPVDEDLLREALLLQPAAFR